MNWGLCWFDHWSLVDELEQRHDVSLHLLNLINEFTQLKLDFNKKLKQVCKKHYLKINKEDDTCFDAYKALLDFLSYTSEYIEQTSKQFLSEMNKIGFEKCLNHLHKSKEKVLETLKKDEQQLMDVKKSLHKAKFENARRGKAHHKAKKNYAKHANTKDEDKYRMICADKQALFESSSEEYARQVEKFNHSQRQSVHDTLPDGCRALQNLYADNGYQWKEILERIVKAESTNTERNQKALTDLRRIVSNIDPDGDQVEVTKRYSARNVALPDDMKVEVPNIEFDELSVGIPTPTITRKLTAGAQINVGSTQSAAQRSYNKLSEPIPPRSKNERSSLRQKKLDDFYNPSVGIRSMSIGGRSMMGDSFGTSSYDPDDVMESNSANYFYIERKSDSRAHEDIFIQPKPKPRSRTELQSTSPLEQARGRRESPRLPPRNNSPVKYQRGRLRSKSPTKNLLRKHANNPNNNLHQQQTSRLSVKSVEDSKDVLRSLV